MSEVRTPTKIYSSEATENAIRLVHERAMKLVNRVDNFPVEGVSFIDILPCLTDMAISNNFAASIAGEAEGLVILPESRAFLFALAFSTFGIPYVVARKPNKRPIPDEYLIKVKGKSEYSSFEFDIDSRDLDIAKKQISSTDGKFNVTIFDDVLATGGTALAITNSLPEELQVTKNLFIAEIDALKGRDILKGEVKSILHF